MSREGGPITGQCLCGSVRYSADADPVIQGVCHCADCQRQTGSPFTVFVGVPRAAFAVEGDTLASFTTIGEDHGGETERNFCSRCGAPIFSISALASELALIKAGSLDDASWLEPRWARKQERLAPLICKRPHRPILSLNDER
jgi:hypothetical protein